MRWGTALRHQPRRALSVLITGLGAAAVLAGCNNQPIPGGASVTTVASSSSGAIEVRTVSGYGRVLVTSDGRSLYLFTADPREGSACTGSCLMVWPPLLASGTVKVGPGVNAKLVSRFASRSGGDQLAYGGHALYTFEQDAAAGMTSGEGLQTYGGTWWLVSPQGKAVTQPGHKAA